MIPKQDLAVRLVRKLDRVGVLTETDRMRIILDVARRSDNPTVAAALSSLLVATQMVHAIEIAEEGQFETWVQAATGLLGQALTREEAHKAVDLTLTRRRPSDMAALANLLEVVHSKIA